MKLISILFHYCIFIAVLIGEKKQPSVIILITTKATN